jgi:hypothetical protein
MDIIILMRWSIWTEHNSWLFNNEDPHVEKCKQTFKREFAMVIHMTKPRWTASMEEWHSSVN